MNTIHTLIAICIVLVQGGFDGLLRRSDVGAFAPDSFVARLSLRGPDTKVHEIEVWRSGASKTLVRFLDPREKGKFLLRLEKQLWLIAPDAKEPVRVSASYRLYGGGTLDEVLGLRLSQEYEAERAVESGESGVRLVTFELTAKTKGQLFPRVRYVVNPASERPVSAVYLLASGRAATSVDFVEWNERGPLFARRVVVKDLLRKGALSDVTVVTLTEGPVPAGLFDLADPSARRALVAREPRK